MIRAPNQLLPKTKVVDLLSLYNFYFGQIPSFYMKFGVLAGQTRAKIIQTSKQCLSCARYCAPDAHTAAVVAGERVHASAIAPDLGVERRSYPRGRLDAFPSVPFLPSPSSDHGESKRAELAVDVLPAVPRHAAPFLRTPSHCT